MSAMTAQPTQPSYGVPLHRKPVPPPGTAVRPAQQHYSPDTAQLQGHSRTRTTSSGVFPMGPGTSAPPSAYGTPQGTMQSSQYPTQYPPQQVLNQGTRRTLSNATSSSTSTNGTPNRSNSGALRRSSSSRSGNSPSSYVAMMRKQKATVWCDRAQYEDPRILAQQRAAKLRANMEVVGGPHHAPPRNVSGSSSVAAGVRSKITHRAPKASLYAPANMAGTGVPMRLSATEVDEGDSEDNGSTHGPYHQRTGSGRSSLGSGRRVAYANPAGRLSTSSTPPNGISTSAEGMEDLAEEETPMPGYTPTNYFEHTKTGLSGGSGSSSGERNFGDVGQMPQGLPKPATEKKTSDDLHRRGSVDERTTTMSNTRLFIANPDLSD
ncbi:hypothetical protein BU24DRAFT_14438 [Aaosphaeria arxii CBS 175.79]|uniref:Uncharacterized protein n=1 Tax=Aaosphaeria arxii CBS 175.79 TaxID=1450172 RepID=A0A6A5Y726_9PLEO|nr:uncharacterized protein BU24DRAFT_14438 [Aaosphaeria arxii CBS 175.79]KAF2021086.1 hypothetical protein BU24DRAFT_14438 [Aaosphaeria arxii CBS 175.79]